MLYIIHAKGTRDVKIGYTSRSPEERARELQGSSPNRLCVAWECMGTKDDEAAIHRALSEWRKCGEWFGVCDAMLAALSDVANRSAADAIRHVLGEKVTRYFNEAVVEGTISRIVDRERIVSQGSVALIVVDPGCGDTVNVVSDFALREASVGDAVRVVGRITSGGTPPTSMIFGRVTKQ